ncbi:MAG: hypothetical protein R6W99_08545, partial [Clostridia bacterium]
VTGFDHTASGGRDAFRYLPFASDPGIAIFFLLNLNYPIPELFQDQIYKGYPSYSKPDMVDLFWTEAYNMSNCRRDF